MRPDLWRPNKKGNMMATGNGLVVVVYASCANREERYQEQLGWDEREGYKYCWTSPESPGWSHSRWFSHQYVAMEAAERDFFIDNDEE